MRVLFIMHTCKYDGSTISFINMLAELIKNGIEPLVAIPEEEVLDDNLRVFFESNNIIYVRYQRLFSFLVSLSNCKGNPFVLFRKWTMYFLRYYKKKTKAILQLSKVVEDFHPQIIHSNTGVTNVGYWLAQKYKLPHVWHLREYQDLDFKHIFFPSKKCLIKKLSNSYPIAISEGIYSHFKFNQFSNACVIYNGICHEDEIRCEIPKQNYFLCASRVDKEKGIADAIMAFAQFHKKHNEYSLLIAGSGKKDYADYLNRLSYQLGCENKVKFLGFRKDVLSLMSHAKALLVPSFYEGFGRMTAEAAFAGCRVIGRNSGGTREVIHKTGGFMFDNIDEFVDCMEKVHQETEQRFIAEMTRCQQNAIKYFSIESNVIDIMRVYQQISKQ